MKSLLSLLLATSCLTLAGCETIQKTMQSQTIDVAAIDDKSYAMLKSAHCSLIDNKENVYKLSSNPGSVTVPRGMTQLYLSCKAPSYYQTQVAITSSLDQWDYNDLYFLPDYIINTDEDSFTVYPKHILVFLSQNERPSKTQKAMQFKEAQKKDLLFQQTQI